MQQHQDHMQWKVLSSTYLYRDNWFTARRDRCETPSGKIVDPYYVLEYPNWVNALAFTEDEQVILIRQYRHALGKTILELPGGVVDDTDASPLAAVERELREETGYTFQQIEPLCRISPNPSTQSNLCFAFLATGGKKTHSQSLDPNEEIEVVLVSKAELRELIIKNEIWQALHVTTLLYGLLRTGDLQWATHLFSGKQL
ncbi:NUDIX hydrolase [Thermoflavifilum thermophilum]|uniref:8-oxo-dGTP pyrophosphatase MutT, NUDIX family n=1 Tax=Thermoflavifilum thermophilum TaxID=1393122 RepID=A0A1I7NI60_9BACT|nr:NUDIX hydrolase [Thermoflavifilum thermophilum]SFV34236.1 8-oxo-dGTP pyrophosphatase MutT, NUDIX family [Thermoflavifilum thermophilum]